MILFEYLAELVLSQLENRQPKELPAEVSVEELVKIAVKSHMSTLLLGALLKLDLPEEQKQPLTSSVLSHILLSYSQQNEFQQLIKAFEENNIHSQPMKGVFMKQYYPKPELREMSDIDILISEDQLEQAEGILTNLGYAFSSKESHHDIYRKANNRKLVLEVHWTMYDGHVDKNQHDYFHNFSRAIPMEGCKHTYTFTKEDFYVFMISHMAKHFYARGCGIRNLVDIYVYQKKFGEELDKAHIKRELKKCGIYDFARHMETLSDLWLNKKECSEFYLQLFHYMLDCGIYGKDENGMWNKYANAKTGGKETSAFQLKLWYLFPPMDYMEEWYPWIKGKKLLLPIGWVVRFLGGITKNKGANKREYLKHADNENVLILQNIYRQMGLKFTKH